MLKVVTQHEHENRVARLNQAWNLAHELAYASISGPIERYQFWTSVRDGVWESIQKEYANFMRHQVAGQVLYNWHRQFK